MMGWGEMQNPSAYTQGAQRRMQWDKEGKFPGWKGAPPVFVRDCGCVIPSIESKKKIKYCLGHRRRYPLTTHPVAEKIYKARVRQLESNGTLRRIRKKVAEERARK